MQEVVRMKMVRGIYEDKRTRYLGMYYRSKDVIEIFVDSIRAHARDYGCDYHDLKFLVVYHELGHRKLRDTELTEAQEEQAADEFAFWTFYKRFGRKPDAVNWRYA